MFHVEIIVGTRGVCWRRCQPTDLETTLSLGNGG